MFGIDQLSINTFMIFLSTLHAWQIFLSVGLALIVCELILPEFFLLWIGFSSIATGVVLYIKPMETLGHIIVFSVLSMISIAIGFYIYGKKSGHNSIDHGSVNNPIHDLIGTEFLLREDIPAGEAHQHDCHTFINGTRWPIRSLNGAFIARDTRVTICDMNGNTFIVYKI